MKFSSPPEISEWLGMQHIAHLTPNHWHERFEVEQKELLFMAAWAYVGFKGTLFDLAQVRVVLKVAEKPYYEVSLASIAVTDSENDRVRVLEARIRALESERTPAPTQAVGPGPYRTLSKEQSESVRFGKHVLPIPVYAPRAAMVDVELIGAPRDLDACTLVFGCLDSYF